MGANPTISTLSIYNNHISKRYHRRQHPKKEFHKELRRNWGIISREVLCIDDEGKTLGILPTRQAISMALQKELDLVEVSPKANPPVCKIMDYGQYVYRQEKAERKHKARQKKIDIKGVRLSLKMSKHDLEIRRNQSIKFLEDGHKLKLELNLRGRERQKTDFAKQIINEFLQSIPREYEVEQQLSQQGGKIMLVVASKN